MTGILSLIWHKYGINWHKYVLTLCGERDRMKQTCR